MRVDYQRIGEKGNQVKVRGPNGLSWTLTWADGNRDDVARMAAAIDEAEAKIKKLDAEINDMEARIRACYAEQDALQMLADCARDITVLILTGGQPKTFSTEAIPDAQDA